MPSSRRLRKRLGGFAAKSTGFASAPLRAADAIDRFAPVNQPGMHATAADWNPIMANISDWRGVALPPKSAGTTADTTAATTAHRLAQEGACIFSTDWFSPEREGRQRRVPMSSGLLHDLALIKVPAKDVNVLAGAFSDGPECAARRDLDRCSPPSLR